MKYQILEATQNGETITTKVEFDFDGTLVEVDIAHYKPQDVKEIEFNIANRAFSEQKILDAGSKNADILKNLDIKKIKELK